jgi:CheY-like chemotaxis protein
VTCKENPLAKLRILVADDSEKLLAALQLQLERHGFEVHTSPDAYLALAKAKNFMPDLLILDIRMPAGNGFSVLERMDKIPELRHTPVIYMTGDQSAELELRAEQMGARGFVRKPISLPKMLELIDTVAAAGSRRTASEPTEGKLWQIPDPGDADAARE